MQGAGNSRPAPKVMIYRVKEAFEFEGRTYLPGELIKLEKEKDLKKLKGKISIIQKVIKQYR